MSDQFAFDVFLSHSSKDKDVVRPLAERLRSDGLRVWFDEWEMKPGGGTTAKNKKIEDGLQRSRVLVLCMSANLLAAGWPECEGQTLPFRDPMNEARSFIPLWLDETPTQGSLAQFVHISWLLARREEAYARILQTCGAVVRPGLQASHERIPQTVVLVGGGYRVSFIFSSDGRLASSCGSSSGAGRIQVWNCETRRLVREFGERSTELAWSANQRHLLSGDDDNALRLWDAETGQCLQAFEGHTDKIGAVALSADGFHALSGSSDNTARLWEVATGCCLRVFEGHTRGVYSLEWVENPRRALSGSSDERIRLWDIETGHCLQVLKGHTGEVQALKWIPGKPHVLSAAHDKTLRLWDVKSGSCLRVFEGHTERFYALALSADGRYVLSGSADQTVRVWDIETGRCLRVLEGHDGAVKGVSWIAHSDHAVSVDSWGNVREWDLSQAIAGEYVQKPAVPGQDQIQYTNAKVLLVGDTGVGKSGLAERLTRGQFVPTKSSHARQARLLESKVVTEANGVSIQQETILWDLAGQPAYRSVHQLSMDDAALACVLFDARSEKNPFEGPAYWSQALDQARTNTKVQKILVAARIDVGGLPASRERIEAFAQENGFAGFIATSASTGEGCDQLRQEIRDRIPWANLPKVTTTKILAALRDYVARLEGEKSDRQANQKNRAAARLFTAKALHEGFASYFGEKIPLDDFIPHLRRLEAADTVSLLVFQTTGASPEPEDQVLLDPTRIDAYSSAILVAAKDEPDGPGHLLESRVREGDFKLDQDERLSDRESEGHVLWYVMEKLLARDLALREKIKGDDYLIFPSQCTAEMPFPGTSVFGVTFSFAGPVRSIYARLIAHLAHYEGFRKREFYQDAAAYWAEAGGRCAVRLRDQGRGQAELEVLYDSDTPSVVRQGFLEFVGKQLEANSTLGSFARRMAYHCATKKCGKPFADDYVKSRLQEGRKHLHCQWCEENTALIDLLAPPTAKAEAVAAQIVTDAAAGRQRMTAALVIKAKEAEGKFDVFLSHNSKDKTAVERIARELLKVGLRPWLDKWNLPPGTPFVRALEHAVENIPCAALCFGPADIGNWHIMEIDSYIDAWAKKRARVIPLILPGVAKTPELPLFVRQAIWVDMRDWERDESEGFYQLVCGILGKEPGDSPMKRFGVRHVMEWQKKKRS
jgi:small GTP-binding protein